MSFGISPFSDVPFSSLPGEAGVSVALIGVQSSGAAGSVVTSTSVSLTGVYADGIAGAVNTSYVQALTGVVATGGVGVVQSLLSLTGVQASGAGVLSLWNVIETVVVDVRPNDAVVDGEAQIAIVPGVKGRCRVGARENDRVRVGHELECRIRCAARLCEKQGSVRYVKCVLKVQEV